VTDHVYSVTQPKPWTIGSGPQGGTTSQYFRRIGVGTIANNMLSAPGAYAFSPVLWESQLSNGSTDIVQRIVIDLSAAEGSTIALKFFGFGANVPSTTRDGGTGAIWGVSQILKPGVPPVIEYAGDFLGRFDLTLGDTRAASSSAVFQSESGTGGDFGPRFSQRATIIVDRAMFPAIRNVGEYAVSGLVGSQWASVSSAPMLVLDTLGYSAMIVELRPERPRGSTIAVAASRLGFAYRVI
jgi:hypothetical protein